MYLHEKVFVVLIESKSVSARERGRGERAGEGERERDLVVGPILSYFFFKYQYTMYTRESGGKRGGGGESEGE